MSRVLHTPTLTASGAVVGRPSKEPPADAVKRIEKLAKRGWQKSDIAAGFGVDPKTLRAWMEEDERLERAFAKGKGYERDKLHSVLRRKAEKGDTIAALFLLKTCHNYRENAPVDTGNRMNVTITLPAALPLDHFRTLPHESADPAKRIPDARPVDTGRD